MIRFAKLKTFAKLKSFETPYLCNLLEELCLCWPFDL